MSAPAVPEISQGLWRRKRLGSIAALSLAFVACNCEQKVADPVPEDAAERYAAAVCDAAARCGCIEAEYPGGAEACRTDRRKRFQEIEGWASVEFDLDCFETFLAWLEKDECASVEQYREDFPPSAASCRVFTGTLEAGGACEPALYEPGGATINLGPDNGGLTIGPCKPGLICYAGTCLSPHAQPVADAGGECHLSLGAHCTSPDQLLYCARDGVCRARKQPGEACDTPIACDPSSGDYFCEGIDPATDEPGTCVASLPLGEPCDPEDYFDQCAQNGYCDAGGTCVEDWGAACYLVMEHRASYEQSEWIPSVQ